MFIEFVNQNIWLFVALVVVFNLLILSILSGRVKGAKTISALEMPRLQRNDNCVVIDVNSSKDFAASHIPNSVNFQLEDLNAQNNELMKHKDNTAILVCQSGSLSVKAAKTLVGLGFSDITILNGGLISWTKENLPTTSS